MAKSKSRVMRNHQKRLQQKRELQKKTNVVAYLDSPTCATGFGTVSRNILTGLHETGRYNINVLGINYWGDPNSSPFPIWPVGTNPERDPYGRKKVVNMIPRMMKEETILFFLQDTFILNFLPELQNYLKTQGKDFRSICYFPIDGVPKEQWIHNVNACDNLIAYSEFGKAEAEKACPVVKPMSIIPHGVNTSDYFLMNEPDIAQFRQQYFGAVSDKFIWCNVNRNQQRKDIPRTIAAFAEFKKHVNDSILYLHMAQKDQGWNLPEVVRSYGLTISEDIIFPEKFGPNQGYPRNIVNMIYNACDCVLSTTLGEGFGLAWIEAMATNTPIIMPNNTAMPEFIDANKGYLVKSGTNSSLFTTIPNDNEIIRPLVDVDDLVKTMLDVYNNKEEAKRRADNAYNWVTTNMDWKNNIVPQWIELFDEVNENLQSGNSEDVKPDVIGTEVF